MMLKEQVIAPAFLVFNQRKHFAEFSLFQNFSQNSAVLLQ